ncbi:MAG TPA: hypothetical protein PK246_06475 [Saprospiraceae bacterium]|nr:hypothetical protein [Saprospiraceae bacterium]
MKKLIFLFCLTLIYSGTSFGQLVNNGATILVKPGATLFVASNIENNTGATITNQGIIEVQGDLTNAGTLTSDTDSKVVFSGSADATLTSGGAVLNDVDISKTAADVILADNMSVNGDMVFLEDDNQVHLGNFDIVLTTVATLDNASNATRYITTDGTGMVQKNVDMDGSFDFPVGNGSDYSPLSATYTGSAYTTANMRVKVNPVVHSNKPADATDYISRYWDVDATGIADYSNALTGTYVTGDVTGTDTNIKGTYYDGTTWNYDDSDGSTNTVSATTSALNSDFTGTNFFGSINLKVFLQGAYSGGTMTTTLNTNNLIPLTSPYAADAITVSSIPADVTDWVLIELRDATTPTTVLSSHSAFLKNDGTIVGTDGTSLPSLINAGASNAIVAVWHRNHLPIRTAVALPTDEKNPDLHDFTTGLSQAYDNLANSVNDAMIDLGSGVYGLFRGNVNMNTAINVADVIQTKNGTNPSQVNVYSNFDVNLNGSLNVADFITSKSSANPTKNAHL